MIIIKNIYKSKGMNIQCNRISLPNNADDWKFNTTFIVESFYEFHTVADNFYYRMKIGELTIYIRRTIPHTVEIWKGSKRGKIATFELQRGELHNPIKLLSAIAYQFYGNKYILHINGNAVW